MEAAATFGEFLFAEEELTSLEAVTVRVDVDKLKARGSPDSKKMLNFIVYYKRCQVLLNWNE